MPYGSNAVIIIIRAFTTELLKWLKSYFNSSNTKNYPLLKLLKLKLFIVGGWKWFVPLWGYGVVWCGRKSVMALVGGSFRITTLHNYGWQNLIGGLSVCVNFFFVMCVTYILLCNRKFCVQENLFVWDIEVPFQTYDFSVNKL